MSQFTYDELSKVAVMAMKEAINFLQEEKVVYAQVGVHTIYEPVWYETETSRYYISLYEKCLLLRDGLDSSKVLDDDFEMAIAMKKDIYDAKVNTK